MNYARDLAERPPYIMVLDVGKSLTLWDRWQGTYGGYHLGTRIDLRTLADRPADVALLRDIWNDPGTRDPRRHAQAITVEIAALLGELSRTMEDRGEDAERVARFLIRCVFSMFAEDVKLLPNKAFTRLLDAVMDEPPDRFVEAAEDLWKAMDAGTRFGYDRILRFNGHFFASRGSAGRGARSWSGTWRRWRYSVRCGRPGMGATWQRGRRRNRPHPIVTRAARHGSAR